MDLGIDRAELTSRLQRMESLGLVERIKPSAPEPEAEPTTKQQKIEPPRKTLVGSLTPELGAEGIFPLLEVDHSIGRTPNNSIPLNDPSVSSRHAHITRTPEGFVVEDLGSRNGTFVNGDKVSGKHPLKDGDVLRFGKVVLTFNIAQEARAEASTHPEVRVT
jgi:pSer/pThr/pTyr-binding forkhead associated (FHA) protein